ncbi:hypothetical protein EJ02DRAFT_71632 [Clathrospora elynae]|uniref:Uncharacterized protein n=1 Tax=Clathrospora elynae TaxID=706981 RepID=A0A6A5SYY9_9PLEO|nr:hypothetical protein EJ02DRAFT_71632 [Clathrospora elynae]
MGLSGVVLASFHPAQTGLSTYLGTPGCSVRVPPDRCHRGSSRLQWSWMAPAPSHTMHVWVPRFLHSWQPLPLQTSHFVVPFPLHVGQSFIFGVDWLIGSSGRKRYPCVSLVWQEGLS